MRSLVLACLSYADDSEGEYPENLQNLVYEGYLDWPEIWMMKNEETGERQSIFYRKPTGATERERAREVIMISPPMRRENYRVLGFATGAVSAEWVPPDTLELAKGL